MQGSGWVGAMEWLLRTGCNRGYCWSCAVGGVRSGAEMARWKGGVGFGSGSGLGGAYGVA